MIAFLCCFTALLITVCYLYLFPALEAMKSASNAEKTKLRPYAALLAAVLLIILFSSLCLTVRFGRFFFPRTGEARTTTKHVDAWAEAGKRVTLDKSGDDDSDNNRPSS